jgi:hypothetical protein
MDRATVYQIRIRGQLDPHWMSWFEGLEVADATGGDATLTGLLPDQPALHGVLARIRDLGLDLVSVEALGTDGAPQAQTEV